MPWSVATSARLKGASESWRNIVRSWWACGEAGSPKISSSARSSPSAQGRYSSIDMVLGSVEALGQVGAHLVQCHAFLGHGVAVADGHGLVLEGVEVHGDAERRADLVLAAVAAANGAGVVEVDVPGLPQLGGQRLGLRGQVLVARERQHRGLDRGQA